MDAFAKKVSEKLPLATSVLQTLAFVTDQPFLADLYERHRGHGFQWQIEFPLLVSLIGDALTTKHGSGTASFEAGREDQRLRTSVRAAQRKLNRIAPAVSMALVSETAPRIAQIAPAVAEYPLPASLAAFTAVVIDGKVVKRVAKRLKALRAIKGGILGGRALVAFHYEHGTILDLEATEDGDANDAKFVPQLVEKVRVKSPGRLLWIADRQFGLLKALRHFADQEHAFLVRATKAVPFVRDAAAAVRTGQDQQGRTYRDEEGWLGAERNHERRYVRRLTIQRVGADDLSVVTNLLDATKYLATDLLEAYRGRVNIEYVFQRITEVFNLRKLIGTSPRATIFQLAYCLVLYNVMQVLRGTIAAANDKAVADVSPKKLFDDTCDELKTWTKVIPWSTTVALFGQALPPEVLAETLHQQLSLWRKRWRKAKRRPNRPPKPKGKNGHHSAYRVLQQDRKSKS